MIDCGSKNKTGSCNECECKHKYKIWRRKVQNKRNSRKFNEENVKIVEKLQQERRRLLENNKKLLERKISLSNELRILRQHANINKRKNIVLKITNIEKQAAITV